MNGIRSGYLVGNGAAQNIELGFIPDLVIVTNVTDGDVISVGHIGPDQVVPFSGGGTTEITAGSKIKGATSSAVAWVKEVLLYSGTWAGGDAAGFFVVEMVSGTFQSENAYISNDSTAGTDDATVTANVTHSVAITTAVATVTGTSAITPYVGALGSAAKGFTLGSVICEEAKLLRYIAFRGDE